MKSNSTTRKHAGPSLVALALVYLALFIASIVAGTTLRHGGPGYVNPCDTAEAVQAFFTRSPEATRAAAFFFFGSAIPLGIYAATVSSRLRFLGVRAAGTYIALFGGFAAAGTLLLSSLCAWVISVPEVYGSLPTVRAFYWLLFLLGGAAFAASLGLLIAGVAVTSMFARLLPKWLIWFGLVIAFAGELSTLSLIAYPATFLIPITRFGGFIWLIAAGAMLPKTVPAGDGAENL